MLQPFAESQLVVYLIWLWTGHALYLSIQQSHGAPTLTLQSEFSYQLHDLHVASEMKHEKSCREICQ